MTDPPETTIAAIATPPGQGALAVVRVTGSRAVEVVGRFFSGRLPLPDVPPRTLVLGRLLDAGGGIIDEALVTRFESPASYTGEDVVEISCHGGVLVTGMILERLFECGAEPAEPGEFTRRAFLNGRLDLTQAEAVMDVISATTSLALRSAHEQLEGRLGRELEGIRALLLEVVARLEAYIDFPDEEIDTDTGDEFRSRLDEAAGRIDGLLATADQGRLLREGVRTVLCGAPNVGKSSLLNVLLGFERAIVSATPGTTRDTIEEVINLRGLPLRLVDTAGVRAAEDAIEREGVARTLRQLQGADLVLEVVDASRSSDQARVTGTHAGDAARVLVLNKSDLGVHPDWAGSAGVAFSCVKPIGREALGDAIQAALAEGSERWEDGGLVAINARHQHALRRAREALDAARTGLASRLEPELVAVDLRAALEAVGSVVGRVDTEEVLGEIFRRFCIGK